MKRLLSLSLLAVLSTVFVTPEPAHAGKGWWKKHGKNGKNGKNGKHGKGGHHDDDDDDDDGGGGGGGGGTGDTSNKNVVMGAGQRGVASFGGKIVNDQWGTRGVFVIDIHPTAPAGPALSVACRFLKFENFEIQDNRVTFRGTGGCRTLNLDGTLTFTQNVNDFQIIDAPAGDLIDVDFVGETGIAVPGGTIAFGDLIVRPAS